jgi:probable blue pigment (indigoidine) exporter
MRQIRGEFLIAFAAVAWGSAYPATTLVLHDLAPIGAAAWRGALSAIVMAAIMVVRGEGSHLLVARRQVLPLAILGSLGGTLFFVGLNASVMAAGSSVTAFLAGSYPVVMVVTAPLVLGERLSARVVAAAGTAILGTMLLTRPATSVPPAAVVTALVASLAFALYLQLARKWSGPYALHPGTVATAVMACVPVGCVPIQLLLDPAGLMPGFSSSELLGFGWLVIVAGGLAHLAANTAVRRLPAATSAAFLFLVPLTGAVIGSVAVGDRLDPGQVVGGVLIILAIVTATMPLPSFRRHRPARVG